MIQAYPQPGAILAERYRVEEVIGRGGMGVVLSAENIITQRRVAIKWLRSDLVDNAEAAERLVREASVASRIRHPNVVDVFDVVRDGTAIFLVMDLLQGESLEALLHRGGIPLHELVSILLPAMRGVAEAHRQDIVHRDIHPGNIFLSRESHDPRPVPMVLDFGISKFGKESTDRRALTRSNMCMGTPLYMSYEQLYSARDVDGRTDVYSFGVILYEGITGKPPFDGESLMEVAGKITAGTPVHPKVLRPEVPTALAELVLWAMARNRDERIPSIEAFIRELEPFATERAFRAQMTEVDNPIPQIARSERSEAGAPPLTTLASRPALAKTVDTLGQHSSELARSLRPAVPNAARQRALGLVAAAVLLVGGVMAAWKFAGDAPTSTTREQAASVTPVTPPPAPKAPTAMPAALAPAASQAKQLPRSEPTSASSSAPSPAALPAGVSTPTSVREAAPAVPPAPAQKPSALPVRGVRPQTPLPPAPKRQAPPAVLHRAGELNPEDL